MRIAFSGTHASGKSTLIAELRRSLRAYDTVEEPYYDLLDEGHVFAAAPSLEDLELQLARSVALITSHVGQDVLFDRCPADFLAYFTALRAVPGKIREWVPDALSAIRCLDVVVFVPLEQPDRIGVVDGSMALRKHVDAALRDMLLDDGWGFGARVLEVRGAPAERARQVRSLISVFETERRTPAHP
jgi:hypothetical protein